MKSIIVINLCVALLLSIVLTEVDASMGSILDAMAENGETIDNRFKPLKKGGLSETYVYARHKGILLLNNKEVVMTFAKKEYRREAEYEYKMYTYLNAINNQSAENYGIPTIYYYGEWKFHILMATTPYDSHAFQRFSKDFTEVDVMILCREFVRSAKFMHSRGVYNKGPHIIFNKNQFLIHDFDQAKDLSKASHHDKLVAAQEDLNSFFLEIFTKFKAKHAHWDWLGYDENGKDVKRMKYMGGFVDVLREDSGKLDKLSGLRKVFVAFATYAYFNTDDSKIMFYDELYRIIVEEIKKIEQKTKKPPVFSWLSNEDKEAAEEASKHLPSIKGINDPFGNFEIVHGKVQLDFFDELYHLKPKPKQTLKDHLENEQA